MKNLFRKFKSIFKLNNSKNSKIFVWSYLEEFNKEKNEIYSSIKKVLNSGKLILGPNVEKFEKSFSKWCDSDYGVGVANGTDAVFLALKALKISSGDEVITVSNTAVPTVSAIVATGAKPVFLDVKEDSFLLDLDLLEKKITPKTKAVIVVHLFGQMPDMDHLLAIVKRNNLYLIEDCAQAHGSMFKERKAGSFGDISAFSFYPTKILGTYGDGGMCITKNEFLYKELKRLRFYGMEKTYYSISSGYNSRLDELHASILNFKLKNLNNYINKRREIAKRYDTEIINDNFIKPTVISPDHYHSYYLYVLKHNKRDIVIDYLKKNNVFVNISYPWPIHTMDGFSYLNNKLGDLPITEKLANQIFSLPMYPDLSYDKQTKVIELINNFEENNNSTK